MSLSRDLAAIMADPFATVAVTLPGGAVVRGYLDDEHVLVDDGTGHPVRQRQVSLVLRAVDASGMTATQTVTVAGARYRVGAEPLREDDGLTVRVLLEAVR